MSTRLSPRLIYGISAAVILLIEIFIALFVNDRFIRPYGGDILVAALLCCMVRIVFPKKPKLLSLYIFIFSVLVETAQYFDIVSLLGLSHISFFRILIGTSFSFIDILCYGLGCVAFAAIEGIFKRKTACQR